MTDTAEEIAAGLTDEQLTALDEVRGAWDCEDAAEPEYTDELAAIGFIRERMATRVDSETWGWAEEGQPMWEWTPLGLRVAEILKEKNNGL